MVVGLIDEQTRVAQVVPEGRLNQEASVFGEIVYWQDAGYAWRRRRSLYRLDEVLDGLGVNIIHALDGRLWRAAAELGRRNDVPVVYSSFSRLDLPLATRLARKLDPTRSAFTAASEPLAQGLRAALPPGFEVTRFDTGIHRLPLPDRTPGDIDTVSVSIAGTGQLDDQTKPFMAGAAAMVRQHPQTHLFFDGQGADQRHLWREAQRLGLLSHATFVPRRLGHRELLLRAELLVHPQAAGRVRGLTLEAMAHGVPILARVDPHVDDLIDGQTAKVLVDPDAEAWCAAMGDLVASASRRAALASSAHAWVQNHRLASTSVAEALHVYRTLTGATLTFAPSA